MEPSREPDSGELQQWLSLLHSTNPCLRDLNRLVQASAPDRTLPELPPDQVGGFLERVRASLPPPDADAIAADLRWLEQGAGRHLLPITDHRYPWLLREIPDPPLLLYAQGDLSCLANPCLAIVGSRNPTPQGRETAFRFARELAATGFTIVSGLALGIDGCAHRGALETGATAGVCAHGLDTVYPGSHRRLAAAITEGSVLLSELPIGCEPRRHQFPRRNRIISGMSIGTLVVEAGLRSGSLITANLAADQNREVFAVPGPITSPQARGCHDLIRKGAALVESIDDILRETGHRAVIPAGARGTTGPERVSPHAGLLKHMGYAPCTRDELVRRSGLTSAEVSSMLLMLELEGCVELCPGGTYVRVTRSQLP
ncbi:MAG TPA: DNA-processing protein DprA [Arenicellales bacterium]|nr:DNA-processing protein DprA [Arenicellales bacterium]